MILVGYLEASAISGLTTTKFRLKIPPIPVQRPVCRSQSEPPKSMNPTHSAQSSTVKIDPKECKHPRVRVVTREADSEFVECLECGEVFESSEFRDMDIEEHKLKAEAEG